MSKPDLLNLSAAIRALRKDITQEELARVIPKPQETLDFDTLRALSELLRGNQNPVTIEFFLNELTDYIQKRGIETISIIYLGQNCAVTFFDHLDKLTEFFLLLKDRYPTVEQYKNYFGLTSNTPK